MNCNDVKKNYKTASCNAVQGKIPVKRTSLVILFKLHITNATMVEIILRTL